MALVWSYEARGTLGVMHLAGYLGTGAVDRFEGALGWVIARRPGVMLLDGTGLLGWSGPGRAAIGSAATRLSQEGISAHACVAPNLAMPEIAAGTALSIHPDLATALAELERTDQPGERG